MIFSICSKNFVLKNVKTSFEIVKPIIGCSRVTFGGFKSRPQILLLKYFWIPRYGVFYGFLNFFKKNLVLKKVHKI